MRAHLIYACLVFQSPVPVGAHASCKESDASSGYEDVLRLAVSASRCLIHAKEGKTEDQPARASAYFTTADTISAPLNPFGSRSRSLKNFDDDETEGRARRDASGTRTTALGENRPTKCPACCAACVDLAGTDQEQKKRERNDTAQRHNNNDNQVPAKKKKKTSRENRRASERKP